MLYLRWRLRAIAEHVDAAVRAIQSRERARSPSSPRPRLIVAPFSNGGYFVFEHLRAVLEERGDIQMVRPSTVGASAARAAPERRG